MSTFAKRLASQDSPDPQARTLERAMAFDRFARVDRATRGKTALLANYRAKPVTIEPDQRQQELCHVMEVLIRVVMVPLLHIGLAPDVKLSYNCVAFGELKTPEEYISFENNKIQFL